MTRSSRLVVAVVTAALVGASAAAAVEQDTPPPGPAVGLELVADGLAAPVFVTAPPDGTHRLFVVDQRGMIRVVDERGELLTAPFLDLSDRIVELNERYDERGVLGLAFHPEYQSNGRFFVYYSAPLREGAPQDWDHTSHLAEFRVSSDDPDRADRDSERTVLLVDEPQMNHNAGHIAFGPDGFLYVPLGDGGGANDVGVGHVEQGNAQDPTSLLGSVLRIDVDGGDPYAIPPDNPFVGTQYRPEIFAYGFRNPYHISFDAGGENRLFVADAGQDRIEEVSVVTNGGNYGWRVKEGTSCFNLERPVSPLPSCAPTDALGRPLVDPVIQYNRLEILGSVVVGGYVYRGREVPELEGAYVFGDYSSDRVRPRGRLFEARERDGGLWPIREILVRTPDRDEPERGLGRFLLTVGQDADGELYLGTTSRGGPAATTGAVYRIVPATDEAAAEDGEDAGGGGGWLLLGAVALVVVFATAAYAAVVARRGH